MIRQYRKQWLHWHKRYEANVLKIFQKNFKDLARDIPFDKLTPSTLEAYLQFYVTEEKIQKAYFDSYNYVGKLHGKRVGSQINKQINQKDFTLDGFISEFEKNIVRWLLQFGGQRIRTVRTTFIEDIRVIIAELFSQGKSNSEIATELRKLIRSRNFYRWQSLRIARTETTTAANYAATVASSVSGVLMDKVWISAQDIRTRRKPDDKFDHYEMNGKKVPLENKFDVSGEQMDYPGDPKASVGNVVNCRCTVAQVVRRDSQGNIIRTTP